MFNMVAPGRHLDQRQRPGRRSLADSKRPGVQEPADRRVERTRRLLADALIELILERGYDAITVQDLIDRADVGRSTFYTHFRDKDDLLGGALAQLRAHLIAERDRRARRPLSCLRGVIDHAHEQQRLFRAIVGRQSGRTIEARFRAMVVELVREELTALAPGAPALAATVAYVSGGFMAVLVWWLEAPTTLAPDEVDALVTRLTAPALAALRPRAARTRRR